MAIVASSESPSATSADEYSDAEIIDAMETSIPDTDITLDDDLSAASDQDPCPPSGASRATIFSGHHHVQLARVVKMQSMKTTFCLPLLLFYLETIFKRVKI